MSFGVCWGVVLCVIVLVDLFCMLSALVVRVLCVGCGLFAFVWVCVGLHGFAVDSLWVAIGEVSFRAFMGLGC